MKKKSTNPNNSINYTANNAIILTALNGNNFKYRFDLQKLREALNSHRTTLNFDCWSRDLWRFGSWWLERAVEEASAGIINDLVEEYKREWGHFQRALMVPKLSGKLCLDLLQIRALVNERALATVLIFCVCLLVYF